MNNFGFNTSDYSGNTTVTILSGQNTTTTSITLIDDTLNEGDEELVIKFINLMPPYIAFNNFVKLRVVDNDFVVAPFGTPLNPTFGTVTSTQPNGYYNSLDGLSGVNLRQALQDIIANPAVVRAQTYADVIDILNRHPAYEGFRIERTKQADKGIVDYVKLVNGLKAWSTNDQYATIILEKIKSLNTKK